MSLTNQDLFAEFEEQGPGPGVCLLVVSEAEGLHNPRGWSSCRGVHVG